MTLPDRFSSSYEELARWSEWGWVLVINHLWQSTLFAALAFGVVLLLRKSTARARYAVWLVVSAKFVLPSLLLVLVASRLGIELFSLLPADQGSQATIVQLAELVQIGDSEATADAYSSGRGRKVYPALTFIWLLGFAFLSGRWIKRRHDFAVAVRAGEHTDQGREAESLKRVQSWLMLGRPARLVVSPEVTEPGVWGTLRPTVVIPETMAESLSEAELDAVMMHELIHVSRWDNLISNLQMLFCCLFWFHPLVWLIDKELLLERESACDEKVVELGGAHGIYASSLLKVLKFCLGVRLAGVSAATGSNLKRRIDKIMANEGRTNMAWSHRVLIGAVAVMAIVFSITAGLFSRGLVAAQSRDARSEGVPGGVVGGVPGGVPGGVDGGVPGGVEGGMPDGVEGGVPDGVAGQQNVQDIDAELERAPVVSIEYSNPEHVPVSITEARLQFVQHHSRYRKERDGTVAKSYDAYAAKGTVSVVNNTDRGIRGIVLEFKNQTNERMTYSERAPLVLEPRGSATLRGWRWLDVRGDPSSLTVRVVGVRYVDGERWGQLPPPPPSPPQGRPPTAPGGPDLPGPPPPHAPPGSQPPSGVEPPANPKSGGSLQGKAIRRAQPTYPDSAKAERVSGAVVVEIEIDEEGNVAFARAITGHPLLKDAAIEAARQWQFSPTMLEGRAVRVIGSLTFNFALDK